MTACKAAYLALWQRLQDEPAILADKPLPWIGKFLAYAGVHANRGPAHARQAADQRGDQELAQNGSGYVTYSLTSRRHSVESRRVDSRIDLHQAIHSTAEHILSQSRRSRREHDLWALYGLTMLQVCAADLSRMFNTREQSIQAAYHRVRGFLQDRLKGYVPLCPTTPTHGRGQKALPREDVIQIRKTNGDLSEEDYNAVKAQIEALEADTMHQDLLALDGIRDKVPTQPHAKANGLPTHRMKRSYDRVHLMIGALRDPSIRTRRPERRVKSVFVLTDTTAIAIHQLALELLEDRRSYPKLVALHAHINNLAISTTAKNFNIPTSTLRLYAKQIGERLGTPTKPAREVTSLR